MGAAGRDFHNFNVFYRDNKNFEVVAFTAAQIPGIGRRIYPLVLSGPIYPDGIPICLEDDLPGIIEDRHVDEVVLAYSDLSYFDVMHKASVGRGIWRRFQTHEPKCDNAEIKTPSCFGLRSQDWCWKKYRNAENLFCSQESWKEVLGCSSSNAVWIIKQTDGAEVFHV